MELLTVKAQTRPCSRCGSTKPVEEFRPGRGACRECERAYDRERRADPAYREAKRERDRKRRATPAYRAAERERRRERYRTDEAFRERERDRKREWYYERMTGMQYAAMLMRSRRRKGLQRVAARNEARDLRRQEEQRERDRSQ